MQICKILSDNGQKNLPDNVSGGLKNLPDNLKNHRHLSVFRYLIPPLISCLPVNISRKCLISMRAVVSAAGWRYACLCYSHVNRAFMLVFEFLVLKLRSACLNVPDVYDVMYLPDI